MDVKLTVEFTRKEVIRILKAYVKDSYTIPDGATYKVETFDEKFTEAGKKIVNPLTAPDITAIHVQFEDAPPKEMDVDYKS
jgi:hypothetical protein